jgi:orotate phosphoribosyltransferase
VAAGALIDRSAGKIEFPVEAQALLDLPIASYEPEDCPQCREGGAPVKPGSRFVRSV